MSSPGMRCGYRGCGLAEWELLEVTALTPAQLPCPFCSGVGVLWGFPGRLERQRDSMTSNPSLQEGDLWVHNIRAAQSQPSDPARLCVCGSSCVQQLQEMLSLLKSFGLNPVPPKSSQRVLPTSLGEPRLLLPGSFLSWGGSISPAHSP